MIHLWKRDTPLAEELSRRPSLLLLDYDGTLRETESDEGLPPERRELIRQLAQGPVPAAVISGRSAVDLRRLVGVEGLVYCGNFGLEMIGPGWSFLHPRARRFEGPLREADARLSRQLQDVPRLRLQRKRWGLGVDGRDVPPARWPDLQNRLERLREEEAATGLRWFKSAGAWEVLPRIPWGKGEAARLLQRRFGTPYLAAIGDDRPDEEMFRAAAGSGCAVRVGRAVHSIAPFWLKDVPEVYLFLEGLTRAERAHGGYRHEKS